MEFIREELFIQTYSGMCFHFASPRVEEVSILDIAHALANQCRYNGHSNRFYSVAEHSALVSLMMPTKLKILKLQALLHDAAEAYVGDIPTPIKIMLPNFNILEERVLKVIFQKFKVPYPISREAHIIDKRILFDEMAYFMQNVFTDVGEMKGLTGLGCTFDCLQPEAAKTLFMGLFNEYYQEEKQAVRRSPG